MVTAEGKCWSIKCKNPNCGIELTIVDDIDGKITTEMIQACPVCREYL